jgi:hypothetical protein
MFSCLPFPHVFDYFFNRHILSTYVLEFFQPFFQFINRNAIPNKPNDILHSITK